MQLEMMKVMAQNIAPGAARCSSALEPHRDAECGGCVCRRPGSARMPCRCTALDTALSWRRGRHESACTSAALKRPPSCSGERSTTRCVCEPGGCDKAFSEKYSHILAPKKGPRVARLSATESALAAGEGFRRRARLRPASGRRGCRRAAARAKHASQPGACAAWPAKASATACGQHAQSRKRPVMCAPTANVARLSHTHCATSDATFCRGSCYSSMSAASGLEAATRAVKRPTAGRRCAKKQRARQAQFCVPQSKHPRHEN